MDRRGFLTLLGAGAAGFVMDPERLLWRPGAKTIFLPSVAPVVSFEMLYDSIDKEIFTILFDAHKELPLIWRRVARDGRDPNSA